MQIVDIDLTENSLSSYQEIVAECKELIKENLQINGGTLKVSDIFERNFNWANLIIAYYDNQIVGFALVRTSSNSHGLKDFYYYLSDIVVKKNFRKQGVGTELLKEAITSRNGVPIVASVLTDNIASIKLISKFMKCFGVNPTGKYIRFVDNKSYKKLYGSIDSAPSEEFSFSNSHK